MKKGEDLLAYHYDTSPPKLERPGRDVKKKTQATQVRGAKKLRVHARDRQLAYSSSG
jgi:hypothetical protein